MVVVPVLLVAVTVPVGAAAAPLLVLGAGGFGMVLPGPRVQAVPPDA